MILSLINSSAIAHYIHLGAIDWMYLFMPKAKPVLAEAIALFYCTPAAICLEGLEKAIAALEEAPEPAAAPTPAHTTPSPSPSPAIVHTIEGAIAHLASQTSQVLNAPDGTGFSRYDKDLGLSLAQQLEAGKRLTYKQRDAAFKTLEKYRKQLDSAGFVWQKILEAQERINLAESTTELTKHLVRHRGVDMDKLKNLFEERYGVGETRATITIEALADWDKYLSSWYADPNYNPLDEYEFESDEYVDRTPQPPQSQPRTPQRSDIREGVILKHSKMNVWYRVGKITKKNFKCIPCSEDGAPIEVKSAFVTIWSSLENYLIC